MLSRLVTISVEGHAYLIDVTSRTQLTESSFWSNLDSDDHCGYGDGDGMTASLKYDLI
jgi:hypothetical protein